LQLYQRLLILFAQRIHYRCCSFMSMLTSWCHYGISARQPVDLHQSLRGQKSAASPLRLITDNFSAEDKKLLRYFHAIAHQYRGDVLYVVHRMLMNRPPVEPGAEPATAPGIHLVVARRT
jgi:hypothetical protein